MKNLRNILFLFLVFLLTGCGAKTPEKLVRSSLEQIKKLDEKTIQNFVSYQDLVQNKTRDTTSEKKPSRRSGCSFRILTIRFSPQKPTRIRRQSQWKSKIWMLKPWPTISVWL